MRLPTPEEKRALIAQHGWKEPTDSEGNEVRPVFESDDWEDPECSECLGEEISNRVRCDQCSALMINGVFCHETGCPNSGAKYEDGEWVKCRDCFDCGLPVRVGEGCDCMEQFAEDPEGERF